MLFYQWFLLLFCFCQQQLSCSVTQEWHFLHASRLMGSDNCVPLLKNTMEAGCQILWHYWQMMAISTSAISNAVGKVFLFFILIFLNWCQFALISWTVSWLKTAVKLSWLSLVEVVHGKCTAGAFLTWCLSNTITFPAP